MRNLYDIRDNIFALIIYWSYYFKSWRFYLFAKTHSKWITLPIVIFCVLISIQLLINHFFTDLWLNVALQFGCLFIIIFIFILIAKELILMNLLNYTLRFIYFLLMLIDDKLKILIFKIFLICNRFKIRHCVFFYKNDMSIAAIDSIFVFLDLFDSTIVK